MDKKVPEVKVQNTVLSSNAKESCDVTKVNPSRQNNASIIAPIPGKAVYLTFDDGPSKTITPQVLDILSKYGIKASFFLIGQECEKNPEIVEREKEEGHVICNHTYSHVYKKIYSSVQSFQDDVKKCEAEIKSILGEGYTCKYLRFPGGGFGKKYLPLKTAVEKDSYSCISWNIDTEDSLGQNVPAEKLLENVKLQIKKVAKKDNVVILMHDMVGKQTTVDALPMIIEFLKAEGYSFAAFE